jgi:hypothetical protein
VKKGDFVRVLPEGLQGIAVAVDVVRIQVALAWPYGRSSLLSLGAHRNGGIFSCYSFR